MTSVSPFVFFVLAVSSTPGHQVIDTKLRKRDKAYGIIVDKEAQRSRSQGIRRPVDMVWDATQADATDKWGPKP